MLDQSTKGKHPVARVVTLDSALASELLEEHDPAFTVRTRLLNMGRSGAAKKASVIFTGWNAYRQKRTLKTIRVSTRLPPLAR